MSEVASSTSRDRMWHRLTRVTLGLAGLVVIYYVILFIQPNLSPFGGRSEPTSVALIPTSTAVPTDAATATPVATWTPPPTGSPTTTGTATSSPTPSRTLAPSPTFPPTWTPMPTLGTPLPTRSNFAFALKDNEIVYTQYFFSSECNWLGIAGLVSDKEGNPIVGLPVVLNGGGLQNVVTYSGNAPAYGESGWEHYLDNKVKEGDFTIQLYNNKPEPISDPINVRTRADCRGNLIMIFFEQNWDEYVP